jgi:rhodanese-related sulfurtransferase
MFRSFFRSNGVQARPRIANITAAELRNRIDAGEPLALIDVRSPIEYQMDGHIPGSRLLPLQVLAGRLDELPRDKTIVMICRSGNRSMAACEHLAAAGYENVVNLAGGMIDWHMTNRHMEARVAN